MRFSLWILKIEYFHYFGNLGHRGWLAAFRMDDYPELNQLLAMVQHQDTYKKMLASEELKTYLSNPLSPLTAGAIDCLVDSLKIWINSGNYKVYIWHAAEITKWFEIKNKRETIRSDIGIKNRMFPFRNVYCTFTSSPRVYINTSINYTVTTNF